MSSNEELRKAVHRFAERIFSPLWLAAAIVILAALASLQKAQLGDINNFLIFKASFAHLLEGKDLYALHPTDHFDYFKYTPLFSILMAPFSLLPNWAGAMLWGIINSLVPLYALYVLGKEWNINETLIAKMYLFLFLELLTSVQNMQSNGLLLGLMLWGAAVFEREKSLSEAAKGSMLLVLAAFIKPFAAAMGVMGLISKKTVPIAGFAIGAGLLLFLVPLLFVSWETMIFQYQSWMNLLRWDNAESSGISLIGLMKTAFRLEPNNTVVQAVAAIALLIPFLAVSGSIQIERWRRKNSVEKGIERNENKEIDLREFKVLSISSVLLWVVVFNHKAESPTFVIAVCGVYLWALWSEEKNQGSSLIKKGLLWGTLILSTLSSTELFPVTLREFWKENNLKVVPCIAAWAVIEWARYELAFQTLRNRLKSRFESRGN